MKACKIIIFLGHPGSGKGTQGKKLSSLLNLPYLATGDLVREVLKQRDALAKAVKTRYNKGIPQPDNLIDQLLRKKIKKIKYKQGIIFDNYPFSLGQLKAFEKFRKDFDFPEPMVIFLKISQGESVKRLAKRKFCLKCNLSYLPNSPAALKNKCQKCHSCLVIRDDDQLKTVIRRFKEYQKRALPLLRYFKKKKWLKVVDGERPPEKITQELYSLI